MTLPELYPLVYEAGIIVRDHGGGPPGCSFHSLVESLGLERAMNVAQRVDGEHLGVNGVFLTVVENYLRSEPDAIRKRGPISHPGRR